MSTNIQNVLRHVYGIRTTLLQYACYPQKLPEVGMGRIILFTRDLFTRDLFTRYNFCERLKREVLVTMSLLKGCMHLR